MAIPGFKADATVFLDFGAAADDDGFLDNLSGVAAAGRFLWTASDEGRTVECLEPDDDGFSLRKQVSLDAIFPDLPGGKEADLESLDATADRLLICGSHCQVRKKPDHEDELKSEIRPRPSRHLLGSVSLEGEGNKLGDEIVNVPFEGRDSLREVLRLDPYLMPFIDLPSKENGLDIEGCCIFGDNVLLGLRGPLIDSIAVVIEAHVSRHGAVSPKQTHLIDLGGLGVRELTRHGDEILLIAGPVAGVDGPFRLYRWKPASVPTIQRPSAFREWSISEEHPEGMCPLMRHGQSGLLILYDSPDQSRIEGTSYRADWVRFP